MTLHEFTLSPCQQARGTAPAWLDLRVPPRDEWLLVFPPGRVLKRPLRLVIKKTADGRWLATNSAIMTHGVGDTPEAAARDYQSMVVDLYAELIESESILAPHLRRELEYLRTVLG